jgi:hypothetical protein
MIDLRVWVLLYADTNRFCGVYLSLDAVAYNLGVPERYIWNIVNKQFKGKHPRLVFNKNILNHVFYLADSRRPVRLCLCSASIPYEQRNLKSFWQ